MITPRIYRVAVVMQQFLREEVLLEAISQMDAVEPVCLRLNRSPPDQDWLLDALRLKKPDFVVMDNETISNYWQDIVDIERGRGRKGSLFVIIMFGETSMTLQLAHMMGSGRIAGIVSDSNGLQDFQALLLRIFAGEKIGLVPAAILDIITKGRCLTNQERRIASYLSKGWSNAKIASELNLSIHTVKNHVHSILDKLGVSSRFEVAEALRRECKRK